MSVDAVIIWVVAQLARGALKKAGGSAWDAAHDRLLSHLRKKAGLNPETSAELSREEAIAEARRTLGKAKEDPGSYEHLRKLCETLYAESGSPALEIDGASIEGTAMIEGVHSASKTASAVRVRNTSVGGDLEIRDIRRGGGASPEDEARK